MPPYLGLGKTTYDYRLKQNSKKKIKFSDWYGINYLDKGNNVSHIKGDVIDLESDLRNQTRYISKCSGAVYTPSNDGFIYNDKTEPINTKPLHLNACQTIAYKSVPLPYANYVNNSRCGHK